MKSCHVHQPTIPEFIYRVTMVVRNYVLLTIFHNLAQLLCHFAAAHFELESGRQWSNKIAVNKT